MNKTISAWVALFTLFSVSAFAATMTVEGQIAKVVEKKKEIYVKSAADGKKYEYYFSDQTQVTKNGQAVPFSELKEGMKVKVVADKKGKRLDPQQVEILE